MADTQVPASLQPYFDKGIQAYTQGCYDYAVDLLSHVIKSAPDATEARRYPRLAIQKSSSQQPVSWPARLAAWLGTLPLQIGAAVHTLQGQPRRAVYLYEQALGIQPGSRSLLTQLAGALLRAGMDDAGLAAYEELLGLHPNHLPALRHVAKLCMKRGDDARARQCYERILAVAPNDLESQQGIRNLDALGTIKKGFSA